jgi:phytoene dehydrogenase-like protein
LRHYRVTAPGLPDINHDRAANSEAGLRYDAAIIGAGANGLAAAALLARSGATTIVIERHDAPAPRLAGRVIHPGYRASPYADEIAPISPSLFRTLGLAQRGAIMRKAPHSLAIWPECRHLLPFDLASDGLDLLVEWAAFAGRARERALEVAAPARPKLASLLHAVAASPWPGVEKLAEALGDTIGAAIGDPREAAHVAALVLTGRTADPWCDGSTAHLLAPAAGFGGVALGGRFSIVDALVSAARGAGAELVLGVEASELRRARRGFGIALSDSRDIEARCVISTLDLKRSFLALFPWHALPKPVLRHAAQFRVAGATARVLFALERAPERAAPETLRGPVHIAPALDDFARAHAAFREGNLAPRLPLTLRVPSASDPSLAPPGGAVITATFGAVPFRLFDGAWTRERRDALRAQAQAALEMVWPGAGSAICAAEVVVPGDMEDWLGATHGDLDGGEIAPDQMLDLRGWGGSPRTPVPGFYLGGGSAAAGPFGTGAAGEAAAKAVIADLARVRFP